MVKYILLLLVFCSCRSTKNLTKVIDKAFDKKEYAIKKDSTSVKIDTSEYDTEIAIEYDDSCAVTPAATDAEINNDFVPYVHTTQKIKRITIKSKTDLHKKDSTRTNVTDSTKTETKTFSKKIAEQKKTALAWYWYLLLIIVLAYYAYRTAKRYKLI
jgi:hypothetical protein